MINIVFWVELSYLKTFITLTYRGSSGRGRAEDLLGEFWRQGGREGGGAAWRGDGWREPEEEEAVRTGG